MKLKGILTDLICEKVSDDCFKKFEQELFGNEFGGEKDTKYENDIYKLLKKWLSDDYVRGDKSFMEKAFKSLKKCMSSYPDILKPNETLIYRGTSVPLDVIRKVKNKLKPYKTMFGVEYYILKGYTYSPHSKLQSWTPDFDQARDFQGTRFNNESRLVPVIMMKKFPQSELLFNSKQLKRLNPFQEEEIIRYGGSVKCDLLIRELFLDQIKSGEFI